MEVFFYGLFMDPVVLAKNGIEPKNLRKASLKDYALKIGQRASLVPSTGETCYGILMTCDKYSLQTLYSDPSVLDYVPEEVTATTQTEEAIEALCYNLPPEMISGTNTEYAKSLYQLARQYDFPEDYLDHIKSFATGQPNG